MQTGNLPDGVPHPKETLGYQILRWCSKYLVQPDGERAGEPWEFTAEQKRFLLWAYAIDKQGRWQYQAVLLRRSKGWGKTPILATLAIVEFIGPCRFGGWDEAGYPIAVPVKLPLVQIAAVSLEQTSNTRDMIRGALAESPAEQEYGLEIGKERVQFRDGRPGRIEPVASSSRGLEGARPTFGRPRRDSSLRGRSMTCRNLRRNAPLDSLQRRSPRLRNAPAKRRQNHESRFPAHANHQCA
ncbi:hypothetical protein ACFVH6_25765 [Spirillospora sp. NPDC127200]